MRVSERVTAQVGVAQAQVMIASAIGRANDASVRIEEFKATAETPADQAAAAVLADDVGALLVELRSINETLNGIRTDASAGDFKANRINLIVGGGGWVLAAVAILVAIFVATKVIG